MHPFPHLYNNILLPCNSQQQQLKKRIRGQPETVEELRARITREETFKIAWDIV
jgi:hypothetical protein